ncbi:MAG TPA: DUF1707 domain-containing protein [Streptosporangiaceae bacterium]
MGDRDLMRASDEDRQQVIERLRAALEEGRLKMEEFTERMGLAPYTGLHLARGEQNTPFRAVLTGPCRHSFAPERRLGERSP